MHTWAELAILCCFPASDRSCENILTFNVDADFGAINNALMSFPGPGRRDGPNDVCFWKPVSERTQAGIITQGRLLQDSSTTFGFAALSPHQTCRTIFTNTESDLSKFVSPANLFFSEKAQTL